MNTVFVDGKRKGMYYFTSTNTTPIYKQSQGGTCTMEDNTATEDTSNILNQVVKLPCKKKRELYKIIQRGNKASIVTPDKRVKRMTIEEHIRHEKCVAKAGRYWEATEVMELLCFPDQTSADLGLMYVIDHLSTVINNPDELQNIIHIEQRKFLITPTQAFKINQQCIILRCMYMVALECMDGTHTWLQCIEDEIERMRSVVFTLHISVEVCKRIHRQFRKRLTIQHPNKYICGERIMAPYLFQMYPESKDKINEWCCQNLDVLRGDTLRSFITVIHLPSLYSIRQEECQSPISYDEFKSRVHLTSVGKSTINEWMHHIGFKFRVRQNSYFNDKHECK